ncbi:MAG: hypothetical protein ABR548_03075 [Actinomycetota bacterium]
MRASRKIFLVITAVSVVAMFFVGATPAGAANIGAGETITSPNLVFPCLGAGANVDAMTTFSKWAQGQAPSSLSGCSGSLFSGGGALNSAGFAGTNGSSTVAGAGTVSGAYNYSEPCSDAAPVVGTTFSGETGEAYGTLTLSLANAVGAYPTPVTGPATVKVNFFWSRVGVVALVGLGSADITQGSHETKVGFTGTQPAAFDDRFKSGAAAAAFGVLPTRLLNGCGTGPAVAPNDIIITSGTLSASA